MGRLVTYQELVVVLGTPGPLLRYHAAHYGLFFPNFRRIAVNSQDIKNANKPWPDSFRTALQTAVAE
jgi:hypothetical protein